MITCDEAYLLGVLYGKGNILPIDNENVRLYFKIKFRRPSDSSIRSDNVHTHQSEREFVESLKSKLLNDFSEIKNLIANAWNIDSTIDLPNSYTLNDWSMKEIVVITEPISKRDERLCKLLATDELSNESLKKFPEHLDIEMSRALSISFVQGICDACSLVPNEASSAYGGNGEPRIQLEPPQERWKLPVGLCRIFQLCLNIPVNTINWGHPQVRGEETWRGQNHQFRVLLKNIPTNIELYRLGYKREEYKNLYERSNIAYKKDKNCPESKQIHQGDRYMLLNVSSEALNSDLLDEKLKGISVDISRKKNMMICKLLGCKQCEGFFDIEVIDDEE